MTKFLLKSTLLTTIVCFSTFIAKAQLGYNFSQVDLGVATGFNVVSDGISPQTMTQSIHFNFTYNPTPYTNFIFEAQFGKLAGGDSTSTKSGGLQFNNDYAAFLFRGQLQLGELVDYQRSPFFNALKNLYVSAGLGLIVNHITSISRYPSLLPGYYAPGLNDSNDPFIPIKVGYEFKIFNSYQQPNIKIDLGVQYNLVLAGNLDGYAGSGNAAFIQGTIGVKFAIGSGNTSYRKQIPY